MFGNVKLHSPSSSEARSASQAVFFSVEVSGVMGEANFFGEATGTHGADEDGAAVFPFQLVRFQVALEALRAHENPER
jgi:hypothetical protein